MARIKGNNVGRVTANTLAAMERSAAKRQCPKCGRKSALKFTSDEWQWGTYCRWDDCGYENIKQRDDGTSL